MFPANRIKFPEPKVDSGLFLLRNLKTFADSILAGQYEYDIRIAIYQETQKKLPEFESQIFENDISVILSNIKTSLKNLLEK